MTSPNKNINSLTTRRGNIIGLSWRKLPRSYSQIKDIDNGPNEVGEDLGSPIDSSSPLGTFTRGGPGRVPFSDKINMPSKSGVNKENDIPSAIMKRTKSFREAFGSMRQKFKTTTKKRKRLNNQSPYPDNIIRTPASARRSARLAKERLESEIKLYSPFTIASVTESPCFTFVDSPTPSRTPRGIRMGTHTPRRDTPQRILAHRQMAAAQTLRQLRSLNPPPVFV